MSQNKFTPEQIKLAGCKLESSFTNLKYDWIGFVNKVTLFNQIAQNGKEDFSEEKYQFQLGLIQEEYNEVVEAILADDLQETIKELVDLAVVSSYAVRIDYDGFTRGWWFTPNLESERGLSDFSKHSPLAVYQFAVTSLEKIGNFEFIADGILEANMSKFPRLELFASQEEIDQECQRIESDSNGRYANVVANIVENNNEKFVVFKDSNGKIMKSKFFKPFN